MIHLRRFINLSRRVVHMVVKNEYFALNDLHMETGYEFGVENDHVISSFSYPISFSGSELVKQLN